MLMKKIFTLLCAAMMTVGTINAKLVMTESFDRTVGNLNIGLNTSMGSNTTDWWSYSGSSSYIKVDEGSLSYSGYKNPGVGNMAHLWSSGADDFRAFAEVTSGKLYLAAIINVDVLKQGTISDYFLCFGDGTASNMYGRLYSKSVKEGDSFVGFKLGVAKNSETNTYVRFTSNTYAPKTNYLVVVEYEFVDGDKNDVVKLYVNPTKSTTKATLECVQDTTNTGGSAAGANVKADAAKIKSVNLRQGTNTPKDVYVDEIKVATAWADLFEDDVVTPPAESPAISAESTLDFGTISVNEGAEKTLMVSGANLKGAISVASSSALLVPAVSSIAKADAEAEGGYALKLTLTPTEAGDGSATITLSSEDATAKVVTVSWTAQAPAASALTIAEAKLLADEAEVTLNDVVVTRVFQDGMYFSVQDATGALNIADYYGVATTWKVGDKISGIYGIKLPASEEKDGFCTIFPMAGSVAASGVALTPFEVSLANFSQYGPAYIKVSGVSFPADAETFAAGGITISQDAASANLQIPAGCDIIGEAVPASADILGVVCHPYMTDNIIIEKSADVYNRVAKSATGIINTDANAKAVKVLRNGQLYLIYEGKMYDVRGTIVK